MPYPHKYITLTPEEKKRVVDEIKRLTLARRWKRRRPLQMLYFSDQKLPFRAIADTLIVSYSTVCNWVYRYRREGLEGFIAWVNRPGPIPPKRRQVPKNGKF
ncbi:MAG: helix-turn-helix domain-containing protein [Planctomycetota bacterium]|nr:helix-turn-helix domain-containing protein [Planctomycetota bacterium]